jgi:hypothetical protein
MMLHAARPRRFKYNKENTERKKKFGGAPAGGGVYKRYHRSILRARTGIAMHAAAGVKRAMELEPQDRSCLLRMKLTIVCGRGAEPSPLHEPAGGRLVRHARVVAHCSTAFVVVYARCLIVVLNC